MQCFSREAEPRHRHIAPKYPTTLPPQSHTVALDKHGTARCGDSSGCRKTKYTASEGVSLQNCSNKTDVAAASIEGTCVNGDKSMGKALKGYGLRAMEMGAADGVA